MEEVIQFRIHLKEEKDHRLVVRNGRGKKRKITMGSGTLDTKAPRVNDRRLGKSYESKVLPPYLRKSPEVSSILPLLYLKGLSGNAFKDSLKMLLGEGVSGLFKSSIASLKKSWIQELKDWKRRKIEEKFVYLWADGANLKIRLGEDKRLCLLVVIGVTEEGDKRLLAVEGGYRESQESWKLLFQSLIERGLKPPLLLIGDEALGLWLGLRDIEEFKGVNDRNETQSTCGGRSRLNLNPQHFRIAL